MALSDKEYEEMGIHLKEARKLLFDSLEEGAYYDTDSAFELARRCDALLLTSPLPPRKSGKKWSKEKWLEYFNASYGKTPRNSMKP